VKPKSPAKIPHYSLSPSPSRSHHLLSTNTLRTPSTLATTALCSGRHGFSSQSSTCPAGKEFCFGTFYLPCLLHWDPTLAEEVRYHQPPRKFLLWRTASPCPWLLALSFPQPDSHSQWSLLLGQSPSPALLPYRPSPRPTVLPRAALPGSPSASCTALTDVVTAVDCPDLSDEFVLSFRNSPSEAGMASVFRASPSSRR